MIKQLTRVRTTKVQLSYDQVLKRVKLQVLQIIIQRTLSQTLKLQLHLSINSKLLEILNRRINKQQELQIIKVNKILLRLLHLKNLRQAKARLNRNLELKIQVLNNNNIIKVK
jgi:hypothetical protein